MSSNDDISNAIIRHQIFTQRFGSGLGKKSVSALVRFQKAAAERLKSENITEFQRERLLTISKDLEVQFRQVMGESASQSMQELREFAQYEAEFTKGVMDSGIAGSTTLPSPEQISAALDFSQMKVADGRYLSVNQMFSSFNEKSAASIRQEIMDGFVLGETNQQIANRLSVKNDLLKSQSMTLARTATNNASNIARAKVMEENQDILDGYKFLATLDSRTTLLCGSNDGKIFSLSDPQAPRPPLHFNCRSVMVPQVSAEFDLGADIEGSRPSVGPGGVASVSGDTNYESWLRSQPANFQDEVLGKERGELFRTKNIKLDRFVDAKGSPIPLSKLKNLDDTYNLPRATVDVPAIAPPKPVERFDNVLPSAFSTGKVDRRGEMNEVFSLINTPEMGKLQRFTQEKKIKTMILKQSQMNESTVSSKQILNDAMEYLSAGETEHIYTSGYASINGGWLSSASNLYTIRRAAKCNGFTGHFIRHIVIKDLPAKKMPDAPSLAMSIKRTVRELTRDTSKKTWSFSHQVKQDAKSEIAGMPVTTIHEIGHQVHFYAGGVKVPQSLKKYAITQYGEYNSAEFHAEHFVAWVVDRDALAERSQQLAEYFDELFDKAMASNFRTGAD